MFGSGQDTCFQFFPAFADAFIVLFGNGFIGMGDQVEVEIKGHFIETVPV